MAITGSGSLAISLSVFVISAAFLPKGEFPPAFICASGTGVWLRCGIAKKRERRRCRGGRSCDARQLRREPQHHFGLLRGLVAVFNAAFSGLLSRVPAEATVGKSNVGGGSLRK